MAAILLLIVAVLISFVFLWKRVAEEFPGHYGRGGWNNPESRWHPEYEWLGGKAGCTVPCGDSLWQEADHADGIYEGTASGCLFVKRRCAAGNTKWKEEILDVRAESRRVLLSDFYPEAQFSTVYNFDPQKVLYTNTGSRMLYVVFLLLVLDVVGVSLYILRKIKRPLDTIIAGMKRVEQGEEQVVIPPQKEKEFTEIGNAFNNMTKQLAAQRAENEKWHRAGRRCS